jgi:uncharacterized heparinase superfamily protein
LRGADKDASQAYYKSAAQQAIFLSHRWYVARAGLPRFEALAGMIYAGLSLQGMEDRVDPAIAVLARDCKIQIGPDGGIASRNPEELLEILTLLTWVETALSASGREVPETLLSAMARIAPALRAMRLAVDHQRTGATDTFTAVVVEDHGFLAFFDETPHNLRMALSGSAI